MSCPSSKALYANIRGLGRNRHHLAQVANEEECDFLICSETMVRNKNPILANYYMKGYGNPIMKAGSSHGMALYIKKKKKNKYIHEPKYECLCHEYIVVKTNNNFVVYGCYRAPKDDDTIYNCLQHSIANVRKDYENASFVFIGDFNAHHKQWLQYSSRTDEHGRAALRFANESGCTNQLVGQSTHCSGNCLDLLLTDSPLSVTCTVGIPIGTSDHNSIIATISSTAVAAAAAVPAAAGAAVDDWSCIINDTKSLNWKNINTVECLSDSLMCILHRYMPININNNIQNPHLVKQHYTNEFHLARQIKSSDIVKYLSQLDDISEEATFMKATASIVGKYYARLLRQMIRKNTFQYFPVDKSNITLILYKISTSLLDFYQDG